MLDVRTTMGRHTDGRDILMRHVASTWASVTEFTLPARFTIPTHDHPVPHVMVVLRGSFIEATAAGPQVIATGDVRYSPGRDVHTMRTGPGPTSCLVVEARGFPELRLVDRVYVPAADAAVIVAGVRAALYDAEYASPACVEAAGLRLFTFVRERCRDPRVRHHAWVDAGRRMIESWDASALRRPALNAAARAARRHPSAYARAFRATHGVSVQRYVRRRQIAVAWRLLAEGTESLSHVAVAAGFADQSHLTRAIRADAGVPPAELRRRLTREPHLRNSFVATSWIPDDSSASSDAVAVGPREHGIPDAWGEVGEPAATGAAHHHQAVVGARE